MDNSDAHRWGPPFSMVLVGWLGTTAAVCWFLTAGPDPGSRLFSGLAVLVLAACSLYGTRARPRLVASPTGIQVRGLRRSRSYGWPAVADVRLLHTPGLGRKTLTLEITVRVDGVEQLLIFSRLDLGADPRDVFDDLTTVRPTS